MTGNANDQVKERTDFLLEHFRQSGVFKCFECLYCKRIDEGELGNYYKCVHDGVAVNSFEKAECDVMRGCACSWFEPKAKAGQYVARRNAEQRRVWREILEYAERHTSWTEMGESVDERQLKRLKKELRELGVMGI